MRSAGQAVVDRLAAVSGSAPPFDEPRLAALGERHLDHVEVPRHDRRGKDLARLAGELRPEVARRDMREREQPHAGVARDLGRLERGRVQRVCGAVALVLEERRLVDEHVRALGEHAHRLDGRGVAGNDDAPAGHVRRRAPRPASAHARRRA